MTAPRLIRVELPEPPSANRWWRRSRNVIHLSDEARAYKQAVPLLVANFYSVPLARLPIYPNGDVYVAVEWHRKWHKGDLDKRLPVLLDALQGALYHNDKQVAALIAERWESAQQPCAVVYCGPRAYLWDIWKGVSDGQAGD